MEIDKDYTGSLWKRNQFIDSLQCSIELSIESSKVKIVTMEVVQVGVNVWSMIKEAEGVVR